VRIGQAVGQLKGYAGMRSKIVLASVLTGLMGLCATGAHAQQATTHSVWDGVYSDAQAQRGATQYAAHCARCHSANLSGTYETPPLTGRLIPYWAGTTLDELFDYINSAMPEAFPGSIGRSADADIVAFILQQNDFPSGSGDLSADADALKAITFDAHKPQAAPPPAKKRARAKAAAAPQ
jgi:mono/diheme cytochrome c family protein